MASQLKKPLPRHASNTHTETDGQAENIMPLAAHKISDRGIKSATCNIFHFVIN